ncbi:hypothetical protein BOX15_Mlig019515g1, partial [Macrostomum lignano]
MASNNSRDVDLDFEDSDRFDDDSVCSYNSESSFVAFNWRGWKKINSKSQWDSVTKSEDRGLLKLTNLCAKVIAQKLPFELVETHHPPVPEELQLKISFYSFPDSEDDIRLYCCLATGSNEEFTQGEELYRQGAVSDCIQIGFQILAKVSKCPGVSNCTAPGSQYKVALSFDRCRIVKCSCSCGSANRVWCQHVVAVCLHRVKNANSVPMNAPISETLNTLQPVQLRKFAQFLLSSLNPTDILPPAQQLLDNLLSKSAAFNEIRDSPGAPDPTAGA